MGTARDNPYRVPSWQRFPPASSLFNDDFSLMSQGLSAKYRQYAWLPRGRSKLARLDARARTANQCVLRIIAYTVGHFYNNHL